ncbi:MAG: T9SS type A sorting domain-containing protein [Bacteroidales bacterium]|nr:T9SS type A sorting domain-containing protein [Bacteroidales bacterium]
MIKAKILSILASLVLFCSASAAGSALNNDTLLVHYTAIRCDSVIQANATNPDFAVMDVRTPAEYIPDHLAKAINRNFYDPNFSNLISLLPRHKMYVIHCASGVRSGNTFNLMVSQGFTKVVNMLGGIAAWKNAALPTTQGFAPLQMAVSDTVVANDTVVIGKVDTILLTITNRANDTLRFTGITSLAGTEFSTDFNLAKTLEGPFDYTFFIFYTPVNEGADSISFLIESNGGPVQFHISRTGRTPATRVGEMTSDKLQLTIKNYPNPFRSSTTIEYELEKPGEVEIAIVDQAGHIVDKIALCGQKGTNHLVWNARSLPAGIYFCRVTSGKQVAMGKMVKQ